MANGEVVELYLSLSRLINSPDFSNVLYRLIFACASAAERDLAVSYLTLS